MSSYEMLGFADDGSSPSPTLSSLSLSSSRSSNLNVTSGSYSAPRSLPASASTISPLSRPSSVSSIPSWNFPQHDTASFERANPYSEQQHTESSASSNFLSSRALSPLVDRGGPVYQDGYASTRFSGPSSRDFGLLPSFQPTPSSHQLLANASHDQLIRVGNPAHTQLYHEFLKANAKAETLEAAYTKLANAVPQLTSLGSNPLDIKPSITNVSSTIPTFSSQAFPALDIADYPLVKFWNKASWKKHTKDAKDTTTVNQNAPKKGNTRAADGENVTMQFIEDADGRTIDGHRAGEIRKHARSIFNDIAKWTTPPGTWGGASSVMRDYYHQQMYRRFPEVQFCDLDWKAEKIASEAYTHWNPPESIAPSVKLEVDTPSGTNPHLKRPRSPKASSSKSKRQKKALIQHKTLTPTGSPPASTFASASSTPSAPIMIASAMPDVSADLTSPPTDLAKAPSPITDTVHATDRRSPQNSGSVQALEREVEVGQSRLKEAGNVNDVGGEQTPEVVPAKPPTLRDPLSNLFGAPPVSTRPSSRVSTIKLSAKPAVANVGNTTPIDPSATASSSTAPTTSATHSDIRPSKKTQIMRPTQSKTPRNLFAIEYMREHPKTTTTEFAVVFDNLDAASLDKYKNASRVCKQERLGAGLVEVAA